MSYERKERKGIKGKERGREGKGMQSEFRGFLLILFTSLKLIRERK